MKIREKNGGNKMKKSALGVKHKKGKFKQSISSALFLSPSFLGVMTFFILPFLVVIYYSVIDNPINTQFVGMDNYSALVKNDAFLLAAKNTAIFSGIAVPLAVILSLLLAVVVDANIPFKSQIRASFLCPLMVPTASVVLVFQVLFHKLGTVNQIFRAFGISPVDWLNSPKGMIVLILIFLWKNLGYNMVLFIAGMASVPKDVMEVATIEGAGPFYKFFHIKLRYLSPTVIFVTILSIINSFKIFREVYLLTGNYPDESLYILQHFMNNTFNLLEYQKLSTAAIIMSLVMMVIIGILLLLEHIFGKDVE